MKLNMKHNQSHRKVLKMADFIVPKIHKKALIDALKGKHLSLDEKILCTIFYYLMKIRMFLKGKNK